MPPRVLQTKCSRTATSITPLSCNYCHLSFISLDHYSYICYLFLMIKENPLTPAEFDPALDTPIFALGDLVKVTRLPIGTVRMWLERKILAMGPNDKDASGKGSTRLFSLRTVYLAATMAELARLGITPSQAAMWANLIWRLSIDQMFPYREDIVFVGRPASDRFRISTRKGLSADVIFDDDSPTGEAPETSVVVVDVAALVRRCRGALNLLEEHP